MLDSTGTRIQLQETELEKDLGVNVDSQLKFSHHVEVQVNKANKILGMIRRSLDHVEGDTLCMLFKALVRPHLEFCNTAWSPRIGSSLRGYCIELQDGPRDA
mgnify:CR=1 FL=1